MYPYRFYFELFKVKQDTITSEIEWTYKLHPLMNSNQTLIIVKINHN